ncbi:MAG: cellulose biosynthesis protein BcsP [Janthinobacterium lividum]
MTTSEDVSNLFRKFGGTAEQYQELSREGQAEESKARWPLLASLRLAEHAAAPSVRDGRPPVAGAPVPNLQGREQAAGMSPFAPASEATSEATSEARSEATSVLTLETAHDGVQEATAGGMERTLFRKTAVPRTPSSPRGSAGMQVAPPDAGLASGPRRLSAADTQDGSHGERTLVRLAGALGAASVASASAAASMADPGTSSASLAASMAAAGVASAAPGTTPGPALRAGAPRGNLAPAGPRPLSAVFARLMAEQPAARRVPAAQKTSLFARLSRL